MTDTTTAHDCLTDERSEIPMAMSMEDPGALPRRTDGVLRCLLEAVDVARGGRVRRLAASRRGAPMTAIRHLLGARPEHVPDCDGSGQEQPVRSLGAVEARGVAVCPTCGRLFDSRVARSKDGKPLDHPVVRVPRHRAAGEPSDV